MWSLRSPVSLFTVLHALSANRTWSDKSRSSLCIRVVLGCISDVYIGVCSVACSVCMWILCCRHGPTSTGMAQACVQCSAGTMYGWYHCAFSPTLEQQTYWNQGWRPFSHSMSQGMGSERGWFEIGLWICDTCRYFVLWGLSSGILLSSMGFFL